MSFYDLRFVNPKKQTSQVVIQKERKRQHLSYLRRRTFVHAKKRELIIHLLKTNHRVSRGEFMSFCKIKDGNMVNLTRHLGLLRQEGHIIKFTKGFWIYEGMK